MVVYALAVYVLLQVDGIACMFISKGGLFFRL